MSFNNLHDTVLEFQITTFLAVNIEMIEIAMTTVDTIVVVLDHNPILVMNSHILNVQLLTDDLKMIQDGQIMQ